MEPTVLSNVEADMQIVGEKVSGPVLTVLSVVDCGEAIEVANGVEQGLSASIATDDPTEAHRFVDVVEAAVIKINEETTGLEPQMPFGGVKSPSSETCGEQGDAKLDLYTSTNTVYPTTDGADVSGLHYRHLLLTVHCDTTVPHRVMPSQ